MAVMAGRRVVVGVIGVLGVSAGGAWGQSDACEDAPLIAPGVANGDTLLATNDGEACGTSGASPDVWYRFVSGSGGAFEVTLCGSGYDTVLSVHDGCPGTSANALVCLDDYDCDGDGAVADDGFTSRITFDAMAGVEYLVRVSGWNGASGAYSMMISEVVTPPACLDVPVLSDGVEVSDDTTGATEDGGASCASSAGPDHFYTFTPTATCQVLVSTCGSDYDTALSVHDACPPGAGNEIVCNDDACPGFNSEVTFIGDAGASYVIRVAGFDGAAGNYVLSASCAPAPANETCVLAQPIGLETVSGQTLNASADGVPSCAEPETTSPDVWYAFTAPSDMELVVSTCGGGYDTALSIYDGCPGAGGAELACNDDACGVQSTIRLVVSQGVTYYVRVHGWNGAAGAYTLRLSEGVSFTEGADIIMGELTTMSQFGREGDIIGLAIDTPVCNVGDTPLDWFPIDDPAHPFMVFNMYRLMDGRLEQIGQSDVKHGFAAEQANVCGFGCTPHFNSTRLGVGCSDTYGAALNALQSGMGPRWEINGTTGEYTYAGGHIDTQVGGHDGIEHRLQVRDADLDPALNPGAQYFCEVYVFGHDDVDHTNSIGWEPVAVTGAPGGTWSFDIGPSATTVGPAIDAWGGATRTVIPDGPASEGRCYLAATTTDNGDGTWRYTYALFNLDFDRAIRSVTLPVPHTVNVSDADFHLVRTHETDRFTNDPWEIRRGPASVVFSTAPVTRDPESNPIRWASMATFAFDADVAPSGVGEATITLEAYAVEGSTLEGATVAPGGCLVEWDGTPAAPIFDLLAFLADYFAGDADLTGDGATSIFDLLAYLSAYFAGC